MRAAVLVLAYLCLSGCSPMQSGSDQGFMVQFDQVHQRALQDADIIMQGMLRAREQPERLANQNP